MFRASKLILPWYDMNNSEKDKGQVLIVGADSSIGRRLADNLRNVGISVVKTSRKNDASSASTLFLDLSKDISDWQPPENISVAFWCAAVTSLEDCRVHTQLSRTINVDNTCCLARAFAANGIFNVYISSNLVFDGSVCFQQQDATPCPTTEYGRQKAEVERCFLNMGKLASVVRLTKVLTPGAPLLHNWIRSLQNNIPIHPFSDLLFSPIRLDFVITVLARIAELKVDGIVQVSGNADISYEQAARYIAERLGVDTRLVQPIKISESHLEFEAIPQSSTLDTGRLEKELGLVAPDVWQAIDSACALMYL